MTSNEFKKIWCMLEIAYEPQKDEKYVLFANVFSNSIYYFLNIAVIDMIKNQKIYGKFPHISDMWEYYKKTINQEKFKTLEKIENNLISNNSNNEKLYTKYNKLNYLSKHDYINNNKLPMLARENGAKNDLNKIKDKL